MLDRVLPMDPALKILAVDDTRSVTLSIGFVFAKPRYEFTCADSGMDALAKIEADSDPYDVIIVDQEMPCLSGVEFVRGRARHVLETVRRRPTPLRGRWHRSLISINPASSPR
jgi:CheY-like chemotaxis protein